MSAITFRKLKRSIITPILCLGGRYVEPALAESSRLLLGAVTLKQGSIRIHED